MPHNEGDEHATQDRFRCAQAGEALEEKPGIVGVLCRAGHRLQLVDVELRLHLLRVGDGFDQCEGLPVDVPLPDRPLPERLGGEEVPVAGRRRSFPGWSGLISGIRRSLGLGVPLAIPPGQGLPGGRPVTQGRSGTAATNPRRMRSVSSRWRRTRPRRSRVAR